MISRSEVSPSGMKGWRSPVIMLMLMSVAMYFSFAVWSNLLNNFAIERANFSGEEISWLQSIREIPGFLSFIPSLNAPTRWSHLRPPIEMTRPG